MDLPKLLPLGFRLLPSADLAGGPVLGGGLPDVYFLPGVDVTGGVVLPPDEYFLPEGDVVAGGVDLGVPPDEYDLPPLPDAFGGVYDDPDGFVENDDPDGLLPDEYDDPDGLDELLPEE